MKQEPGKRIVSKGHYASLEVKRILRAIMGGCLLLTALSSVIVLFFLMLAMLMLMLVGNFFALVVAGFFVIPLCILTFYAYKWGNQLFSLAENMPSVVPSTRANNGELPAVDSLVRASQKPIEPQEAVLLRAVIEGAEKHQEQLLRASPGGQE